MRWLTFVLCLAGCDDDPGEADLPEATAGEATNVVVHGGVAYVALGADGLGLYDATTGEHRATLDLGMDSVDDVALDPPALLLLDARRPGHVAVASLTGDPLAPALTAGPSAVPVGPFSGVSGAGGVVVVSGGTSEMTMLDAELDVLATGDYGRGQPDVLVAGDDGLAFVSTHFGGPDFGITIVEARTGVERHTVMLDGAGFTAGGASPANFPIEAALGAKLLVAHGGGLALVDCFGAGAEGCMERPLEIIDLGFPAVSVDVDAGIAAVVGDGPSAALFDLDGRQVTRLEGLPPGARPTGVALTPTHVVVAAGPAGIVVLPR